MSAPEGLIGQRKMSVAAQERASKEMRDSLKTYFLNEGAVNWQFKKIGL